MKLSRISRSTRLLAMVALGLLTDGAATEALGQNQQINRMNAMDHGPFVSSTIALDPLTESSILAHKAIVVGVAPDAVVAFDTDLLRVAAAWTGGGLHWYTARDGLQEWPTPDGFLHFTNDRRPGWTTRNFNDPRPHRFGPLNDGRQYHGLHVHGDEVLFSYSVGESEILETFGFDQGSGHPIFTRTLNVAAGEEELALHVVQAPGGTATTIEKTLVGPTQAIVRIVTGGHSRAVGVDGLGDGGDWRLQNGHLILSFSPEAAGSRLRISIGPVLQGESIDFMAEHLERAATIPDLAELKRPQTIPAQVVETTIERGEDAGPFAVDVLTLPVENPWTSHLRLSGIDFMPDGRAAVASLSGDVWLVDGLDDPAGTLRWRRFATGLNQPLGLKVVDGLIHVTGRDQITRLHDLNDDDSADFYESFNNQVMAADNFHGFTMNLETDPAGNFYFTKGTPDPIAVLGVIKPLTPHNGTLLRVSPDGSTMEVVATGLRNANGLSIGPDGDIYFADNEGNWFPANTIQHVREGAFFGYVPSAHMGRTPNDADFEKPVVWIPHFVDNSPAQPKVIDNPSWPAELQGDLLVVSYGAGTASLVYLEEVDGKVQGAHLVLPLDFKSGLQHTRFGDDGHLYVVGMTNWASRGHGGEVGSFHRIRYTGQPLGMPVDVRTWAGGLEIRFSEALDPATTLNPDSYRLRQWTYIWSSIYGSRQGLYSVNEPGRIGEDTIQVSSVRLSDDRRSVFLEIPTLRPGPVNVRVPISEDMPDQIEASLGIIVEVDYNLTTEEGARLQNVLRKTIHRVPTDTFSGIGNQPGPP